MLEHAKVLGFAVRQHGRASSAEPVVEKVVATAASRPAVAPVAKKAAINTVPAKKAVSKPIAKLLLMQKVAAMKTSQKKAVAKKVPPVAAQEAAKAGPPANVA